LRATDPLNPDLHMRRITSLSILIRRAHRVRDRERKVRSVDCRGSCDRDPTVERRGTNAYALKWARRSTTAICPLPKDGL